MNIEPLDIDGLHDYIIQLQRSDKLESRIHLENLDCERRDHPHFYKIEDDGWWMIQYSARNSVLNHKWDYTDEMLRNDPTFLMFARIINALSQG